jgi:steroid delta-isomerase
MSEPNALKAMMERHTALADLLRESVICPSVKPGREHMERAARAYLASYLNGDLEGRAALFAPDAVFEDPVGTPPLRGMEQIMPFWRMAQ